MLHASLVLHDRQRVYLGGKEQTQDVARLHTRLQSVTQTLCALEAILDTAEAATFMAKFRASLKSLVERSRRMIKDTQKELPVLLDHLHATQDDVAEVSAQLTSASAAAFENAPSPPCESLLSMSSTSSPYSRDPQAAASSDRSSSPQSPLPMVVAEQQQQSLRRRQVAAVV